MSRGTRPRRRALIRRLTNLDSLVFPKRGESESLVRTEGVRCGRGFLCGKFLMEKAGAADEGRSPGTTLVGTRLDPRRRLTIGCRPPPQCHTADRSGLSPALQRAWSRWSDQWQGSRSSFAIERLTACGLGTAIERGLIFYLDGVVRLRLCDLAQWLWEELRISVSEQTLSREVRAWAIASWLPGPHIGGGTRAVQNRTLRSNGR